MSTKQPIDYGVKVAAFIELTAAFFAAFFYFKTAHGLIPTSAIQFVWAGAAVTSFVFAFKKLKTLKRLKAFLLNLYETGILKMKIKAPGRYLVERYMPVLRRGEVRLKKAKEFEVVPGRKAFYLGEFFPWEGSVIQKIRNLTTDPEFMQEVKATLPKKLRETVESKVLRVQPFAMNWENARPYWFNVSRFPGHTMIVGTTGCGKTKTMEVFLVQTIHQSDNAVIIIDPKGTDDMLNRVFYECERCRRPFRFFSVRFPSASETFNPLGNYFEAKDIADRIYEASPGAGKGESDVFLKVGKEMITVVVAALIILGEPVNFVNIFYGISSPAGMARVLQRLERKIEEEEQRKGKVPEEWIRIREGLRTYCGEDAENPTAWKMHQSILSTVSQFARGEIARLVNVNRPSITWDNVISGRQVVYFHMGADETSYQLCKMILIDFYQYIQFIYDYTPEGKRVPIWVFVDEVSNVVGEKFVDILNKGRGAGVRMVMAMQTLADLERDESAAIAGKVRDNVDNKIFMRIPEAGTAEPFVELAGTTLITRRMQRASVSTSPHGDFIEGFFGSSRTIQYAQEETTKLTPSDLASLPDGQGFLLKEGKLVLIKFPLVDDSDVPSYREKLGVI